MARYCCLHPVREAISRAAKSSSTAVISAAACDRRCSELMEGAQELVLSRVVGYRLYAPRPHPGADSRHAFLERVLRDSPFRIIAVRRRWLASEVCAE